MEQQHPARQWAGCRRDSVLQQSGESAESLFRLLKSLLEFPRKIFGDLCLAGEVGDPDDLRVRLFFIRIVAEDFLECGDGFVEFLFGDELAGLSIGEWGSGESTAWKEPAGESAHDFVADPFGMVGGYADKNGDGACHGQEDVSQGLWRTGGTKGQRTTLLKCIDQKHSDKDSEDHGFRKSFQKGGFFHAITPRGF
jgi:hypothetical protein